VDKSVKGIQSKVEVMTKAMRDKIVRKAKRTIRLRNAGVYNMTDVNQEDGVTAQRDDAGYLVGEDSLTFTVPKNTQLEGATAGDEEEFKFNYRIVEDEAQANKVIAEKEWDLVELVNRKLKADARAAVYQRELNKHKPITTTKTPEQLRASLVRMYMAAGVSREVAIAQVDSVLGANNG
jgi:hypothetical protein